METGGPVPVFALAWVGLMLSFHRRAVGSGGVAVRILYCVLHGAWHAVDATSGLGVKACWGGQPWHTLGFSAQLSFHSEARLRPLAWSPEVCGWCLRQAQSCLETSQPEVPVTQLTRTLGTAGEGRAWLLEGKWSWV